MQIPGKLLWIPIAFQHFWQHFNGLPDIHVNSSDHSKFSALVQNCLISTMGFPILVLNLGPGFDTNWKQYLHKQKLVNMTDLQGSNWWTSSHTNHSLQCYLKCCANFKLLWYRWIPLWSSHDITCRAAIVNVKHTSDFELTKETPYTSPLRASYVVSIVNIVLKINHVGWEIHCSCFTCWC